MVVLAVNCCPQVFFPWIVFIQTPHQVGPLVTLFICWRNESLCTALQIHPRMLFLNFVNFCRFFDNFFSVSRVAPNLFSNSCADLLYSVTLAIDQHKTPLSECCSPFILRCLAFMSSVWASWRAWWTSSLAWSTLLPHWFCNWDFICGKPPCCHSKKSSFYNDCELEDDSAMAFTGVHFHDWCVRVILGGWCRFVLGRVDH